MCVVTRPIYAKILQFKEIDERPWWKIVPSWVDLFAQVISAEWSWQQGQLNGNTFIKLGLIIRKHEMQ